MAAGEIEPDDHHPDLLDHCATVWPADGSDRLAYAELLELLAGHYHGDYQRLLTAGDETTLGKRLRAAGVDTVQVTAGPLKGRKGVRLSDVVRAIDDRDAGRPSPLDDIDPDSDEDNRDIGPDGQSTPLSSPRQTVVLGRPPVAHHRNGGSGDRHE